MTDTIIRKVIQSLLLLAALAGHTSYAEAQSETDAKEAQATAETTKSDSSPSPKEPSADQQSAKKTQDKDRRGEIFRPSEEISEDFAVSFPVDI
ncbi:MAG: hypothetical protein NXH95_16395 [Pseudomonadaceae bacterium]|nr:hypothetical protein [Pseudomonadaceae bacterium]